jgi:hypothetical protein
LPIAPDPALRRLSLVVQAVTLRGVAADFTRALRIWIGD